MKTRKPQPPVEIPAWAIDPDRRDRHTIAAAFHLADLSGKWVRLTARTQRAVFGAVLFGKVRVQVRPEGIRTVRSVCYGTDFSQTDLGWDDVERHMRDGTRPTL